MIGDQLNPGQRDAIKGPLVRYDLSTDGGGRVNLMQPTVRKTDRKLCYQSRYCILDDLLGEVNRELKFSDME